MNNDVFKRIEALEIDQPETSLTFSQRLARENSWTENFSEQVIAEYKKFIYIVYISNTEITPSDEIDQAWHLHLTYTHSYWDDLCKNILGFKLHHHPTKGGVDEQKKYKKQYDDTLLLYEIIFSEAPPAHIWPTANRRFDAVEQFVRVNLKNKWIIYKPSFLLKKSIAIFPLLILILVFIGLWVAFVSLDSFIGFIIFIIIFAILSKIFGRGTGSGGRTGCGGDSGCGGCGGD